MTCPYEFVVIVTGLAVVSGCGGLSEADLQRYAERGNTQALYDFILADVEEPRDVVGPHGCSQLGCLAVDLLAAADQSDAKRWIEELISSMGDVPLTRHLLEQATAHGRRLDPLLLVETFGAAAHSEGENVAASNGAERPRPRPTLARAMDLHPERVGWIAVLSEAKNHARQRRPREALALLEPYHRVGGPRAGDLAEILDDVRALADLPTPRSASSARYALERARRRHERAQAAFPPEHHLMRFYLVANLGTLSDGFTAYEVAAPLPGFSDLPSRERAVLLSRRRYGSSAWNVVHVVARGEVPMRLREELGSFEQVWPVFEELPDRLVEELFASEDALGRAERAAEEAAREEAEIAERANRLRSEIIASIAAVIEAVRVEARDGRPR